MFRGVSELSLDEKGRLAVPIRYRELLKLQANGQCIITIDTEERCLLIYPMTEWEKIEKQIEALPSFNPLARRVQRLLIGHATEANLDGNGRMLVPPPLRDYASLQKEIVLIGQGRKFELWDAASWVVRRDLWLQKDLTTESEIPSSLLAISL
ncbi:MAG: division/cell wall cluster transcriptional repressor MraZ [Candidatus Berkiellales bacterium]